MNPKKRLGEMLIDAGIIDETRLKAALGFQRQWGIRLGQALVDLKLATEADIVQALSSKFGIPAAKMGELEPYALERALKLIPSEFAVRNNVFPMAVDTTSLTVAMSDPTNLAVVDEIRFRTGLRVKVCVGGDREVAEAVRRHYPAEAAVEAIALDLDSDEGQSEALFDPFGGGSKDALEAFFGHPPEGAAAAPAAVARPPPPAEVQPPATPVQPGAERARAPDPPGPGNAKPAPAPAAPKRPGAGGSAKAASAPAASAVAPADAQAPAHPRAAPATGPVVTPPPSVPGAARPSAAPAPRPAAPAPATAAAGTASPAQPSQPRAPAPAQASAARRSGAAELELEAPAGPPAGEVAPSGGELLDVEPAPGEQPSSEPILATDLAPGGEGEGAAPAPGPFTPEEVAILDALERLAGGHHAEPDIVKPTQAMAALARILLRKGIVSERELLDELEKR